MEPYSVQSLFKVGLGPSSSHTLGPMRAAERFQADLIKDNLRDQVVRVKVTLYGSLALTGKGHHTDRAVVMGLCGLDAAKVDPDTARDAWDYVRRTGNLPLPGGPEVRFSPSYDIEFQGDTFLPAHPNAMRFAVYDIKGQELVAETWFSVGGGAIAQTTKLADPEQDMLADFPDHRTAPYSNADELLKQCETSGKTIAVAVLENEIAMGFSRESVLAWANTIADTMRDCCQRGLDAPEGMLEGGLGVRRRAPHLWAQCHDTASDDPLAAMDWLTVYALAVNEENAAGHRVVTAPTNGAAGVIPAVMMYWQNQMKVEPQGDLSATEVFLLTASAIGWLYKRNASISAAEVGCQGEIGVASSMAAAGLCAVLGGTPGQIEHAAEIAMEHHLGLTCDPVGGLVQIPCIERNAVGAVKAVQAARLAMRSPEAHRVSLDEVMQTMAQTGADMSQHYKETALAGLAVNVVVC